MRLGVLEIDYAYFAGTQELSAQIAALDTIIACLKPTNTVPEAQT